MTAMNGRMTTLNGDERADEDRQINGWKPRPLDSRDVRGGG
jgi:hypothetical protein